MTRTLRDALPVIVIAICGFGGPAQTASAGEPVAIVEDVTGAETPLQMMDYLSAGQVIELGEAGIVTIGYFASCSQETVTGGRVTIGTDQSAVEGGQVARAQSLCAGGGVQLSADQAQNGAVMVFRSGNTTGQTAQDSAQPANRAEAPEVTVYGTRPVFVTAPSHTILTIERLDAAEPATQRFDLSHGRLDLAQTSAELAPGGIYRAGAGSTGIVFKIDALAAAEGVGLLARLIRL